MLRRAFDFVETTDFNDAGKTALQNLRHMDRRIKVLLLTTIGSALMLVVAIGMLRVVGSAIEVANRPSIEERLAAPYDVSLRLIPSVDTSVYLVLPTQLGDLALENSYGATHTLLASCLNTAMNLEQRVAQDITLAPSACTMNHAAAYTEWATYKVPGADTGSALDSALNADALAAAEMGNVVTVTLTQFESQDEAAQVMQTLFDFSRTIGRTGNYVLLNGRTNEYFFSSTRGTFSFTWSNGSYVYSVSAPTYDQMEQAVKTFPY